MSEIEWRREQRRVLLPVSVLAPEPVFDMTTVSATALIDTGSTTSGVSIPVARQLQLPRLGKRPLGSAHGEAQIERYLFRIGLPLQASLPYVLEAVMGFELKSVSTFDALIGMDILGQCDFEMRRDGWCRLRFGA